jgi:hypothetical protein
VYIVGANWLYFSLWRVISPLLAEKTREKVVVLAGPAELRPYFDAADLDPNYRAVAWCEEGGGDGGGGDGGGGGGSVDTVVQLAVARGAVLQHRVPVPPLAAVPAIGGLRVSWEFTTAAHDIGFCCWFEPHTDNSCG